MKLLPCAIFPVQALTLINGMAAQASCGSPRPRRAARRSNCCVGFRWAPWASPMSRRCSPRWGCRRRRARVSRRAGSTGRGLQGSKIHVCPTLELSERARLQQILSGDAHYLSAEQQCSFLSAYLLHAPSTASKGGPAAAGRGGAEAAGPAGGGGGGGLSSAAAAAARASSAARDTRVTRARR